MLDVLEHYNKLKQRIAGKTVKRCAGQTGAILQFERKSKCSVEIWRQIQDKATMPFMEPPPAIRRIDTDREDLCALDVVGRFSAADLENAYGLLEAVYETHDRIDLLVRISDYEGFDWSAAFDENIINAKSRALRHIRKYALVGGPAWMRLGVGVLAPFLSLDVQHFSIEDEAKAWEWIDGHPIVE